MMIKFQNLTTLLSTHEIVKCVILDVIKTFEIYQKHNNRYSTNFYQHPII